MFGWFESMGTLRIQGLSLLAAGSRFTLPRTRPFFSPVHPSHLPRRSFSIELLSTGPQRPLEEEEVYLVCGRRRLQLMRDSLGRCQQRHLSPHRYHCPRNRQSNSSAPSNATWLRTSIKTSVTSKPGGSTATFSRR